MWLIATLEFGTLWFWLVFAALSCIFIWTLEIESSVGSTLDAIILGTLLCIAFKVHPGAWILANPGLFVVMIIAWFVVGAAWGVAKWWFYCNSQARRFKLALADWRRQVPSATIIPKPGTRSSELTAGAATWANMCDRYGVSYQLPPRPENNKRRIMIWMAYWPWSMLWTIINDPVRRIFREIYYALGSHLQAISNKAFNFADPGNS